MLWIEFKRKLISACMLCICMICMQNSALCWKSFRKTSTESWAKSRLNTPPDLCILTFLVFYWFDLAGRLSNLLSVPVLHFKITPQQDLPFIFVPTALMTTSFPALSPPTTTRPIPIQVEVAEALLWKKGSALAGLSAVGRLQLLPGSLCHPGGAAADARAAHRYQAVAVWVLWRQYEDGWDCQYDAVVVLWT